MNQHVIGNMYYCVGDHVKAESNENGATYYFQIDLIDDSGGNIGFKTNKGWAYIRKSFASGKKFPVITVGVGLFLCKDFKFSIMERNNSN